MSECLRYPPNPYQLPFEWGGRARELGQHVRLIRELAFVRSSRLGEACVSLS